MKKNIFLYLFIFSLLINVFTYMYFTSQEKFSDDRVKSMSSKLKVAQDSVKKIAENAVTENYFSLENNANARDYFGNQDVSAIGIKVRDAIYKKNSEAGGNPLVGYPAMEGRPFSIAKIKILNHRWIIVDFTNGKQWGEALLRYFIEDDGSITLERADTTLYPFIPY